MLLNLLIAFVADNTIYIPSSSNILVTLFNISKESESSIENKNPFMKRPSKKDEYGKEVKIACCGCFPVAKADPDD